MYNEHDCFEAPDDESVSIWRYMDFAKFVSLLDRNELFFAKSTKFEDPYEGLFPDATLDDARFLAEKSGENSFSHFTAFEMPKISKFLKECMFLNCWHMSECESVAMWKLYSKDKTTGISIKSSFKKLKTCFTETKYDVHIGVVKYGKEDVPTENIFRPYLHKRKSFEYEKEIRAVVLFHEETELINGSSIKPLDDNGIYVSVSLDTLIDEIHVSPHSPKWFEDLVKSVTKKSIKQDKKVIRSDLYNGPLY